MFSSPAPRRAVGVEAGTVVRHLEAQAARLLPDADRRRGRPAARACRRSAAPRGSRSRPSPRPPAGSDPRRARLEPRGYGSACGDRGERVGQAAVGEQRRVDAVGELAQLLERRCQVAAELLEDRRRLRRVRPRQFARQPHAGHERDQPLLRAVVQVALDAPALRVRRRDDARAGGPELLGLARDLVERLPQLRVQPDVAQRDAGLARDAGEGSLVALAERLAVRRALDHHEPEERTRVGQRRDPEWPAGALLEQRRQPHGQPGRPGDPGPGDHRLLRGGDRERRPAAVGIGRRALEQAGGPGPDLRPLEPEAAAQRLGDLQYELVERDRAAQPGRERRQRLAVRLELDRAQARGSALEPLARRLIEERRDGCGGRRDREDPGLLLRRQAAEDQQHDDLDGDDHPGEPAEHDRVDEHALQPPRPPSPGQAQFRGRHLTPPSGPPRAAYGPRSGRAAARRGSRAGWSPAR